MKGNFIFTNDEFMTIKYKGNCNFSEYEPVEITSLKTTYLDELRGLYWVLLEWMISTGNYKALPGADKWFKECESKELSKQKLYILSRFEAGWIETNYDKHGAEIITARSTGDGNISQDQFWELYEKTMEYFCQYVDMTEFAKQHIAAREIRGKFY